MTVSVLRTADAWWVETPDGAARIATTATTTRELLADRVAIENAAHSADTVPVDSIRLLSPVTTPCRVVAQMTNFASHVEDAGMDPKTIPLAFFRKASASISGPFDDIVKPGHVEFLDYEVEIGLVIGQDIPVGTTISEANLSDYIAGLVVTNDVSARDIQLPQTQFYEAKSYPTFTPVGPALVLLDADELKRFGDLRLQTRVSGELRQDMLVDGDMIYGPLQALESLSRFQDLAAGDLVMTGTPAGTALSAPPKPIQMISNLLPPSMRDMRFEQRWLVIDAATDADLDQWDGVHQVCNPARAGTYMRIGPTRYRWEFRLLPGESADDFRRLETLKPLIAPWTSRVGDDELELVRVTEYTFRAQMADRWRRGNVFLLGDAAHLTPPFIGQGMGAGVRDAMNLAWKLAGVISGDLPRAVLDTYEQERKPHTRHMIRLALSVGWAMTAGGELGNLIRRMVVTRMKFVPGLRGKVIDSRTPALHRSAFVHRRRVSRQLAGTLCPNPVLADGRRLDSVLGDGFALITTVPPDDMQQRRLKERGAVAHIANPDGDLADWLRRARVTSAIVRPDRTVMWAGRDMRKIYGLLPTFRPEKRIRSNV